MSGERRDRTTPPRGFPTVPPASLLPVSAGQPGHRTLVTSATLHDLEPPASGTAHGPRHVRYPHPDDVITSVRGSYRVRNEVGRGAQGAVYEAIGPFDQRFALKLQVPAMRPYAEVYSQWRAEAQRLLLLRHPNVVYLHDAFEHDFLFYMALEWCPFTLRDLLARALPGELVIELVRQLLAAIQYLHDNDIVHGDIHAGNILLTDLDRPAAKLADFGISQELQGRGFARPNIVHHAIMAPEVVATGYTSRQSDLYQIGLLFYWMVTGRTALDYSVPYPELVRQVTEGVPRARAEALQTPVGTVIAKMLRRREAYRYASAHEVWEDLRPLREGTLLPRATTRP